MTTRLEKKFNYLVNERAEIRDTMCRLENMSNSPSAADRKIAIDGLEGLFLEEYMVNKELARTFRKFDRRTRLKKIFRR